jgi:hypothetical protein
MTTFFVCETYVSAYYTFHAESKKLSVMHGYVGSQSTLSYTFGGEQYVCLDVGSFMSKLRAGEVAVGSVVVLTFSASSDIIDEIGKWKVNLVER